MTSIISTLAVAFHRLIITRLDPFNCKRIVTAARCVTVCVIIWLVAVAAYFGTYYLNDNLFFNIIQPLLILSAITVCGICYVIIYVTIATSTRGVNLTSDAYARRVRKNKRVLCTFALIVSSNFVCLVVICLCLLFVKFLDGFFRKAWFSDLLYTGWWLFSINAMLNPIIYWTRLSDFRRLLFGCCCCCCRQAQSARDAETRKSEVEEERVAGQVTLNKLEAREENGTPNGYKVEV